MKLLPVVVLATLLLKPQAKANNIAIKKAVEATYKQTGTAKIIDAYAKKLEDKYIPEYLRTYGITIIITKAIVERRVNLEWTF